MILTSEWRADHLFAGQNKQQQDILFFPGEAILRQFPGKIDHFIFFSLDDPALPGSHLNLFWEKLENFSQNKVY